MQSTRVFMLANRTMKKPLLAAASVALSFGVLLGSAPAFADPAADILGTYRDTSEVGEWKVKALGPYFHTEYVQAEAAETNESNFIWVKGIPWISFQRNTFGPETQSYSYMTIINDSSFTAADPAISFSGLSLSFAADDFVSAFFVNGVRIDGIPPGSIYLYTDHFIPSDGSIPWNLGGDNTIEFIVTNTWQGYGSPTGLSASIQAHYAPIPEPETWAMLLAGLGIVGAVTRRKA